MNINLAQATLHFLNKAQNITADEVDVFKAVRDHWKQEAEKAAQPMTPDVIEEEEEEEDAA